MKARPKKPAKAPAKKPEKLKTDPAAAAERVLGGGDAAAPAPKTSTERVRAYRARKKGEKTEEPQVIDVGPGDVEMAAQLGGVVWDIVAPFVRLKPLDDSQRTRLGTALAPLIIKYMPLLGDWQYEAAAVLCVLALVQENRMPRELPKKGAGDAGEVSTQAGTEA